MTKRLFRLDSVVMWLVTLVVIMPSWAVEPAELFLQQLRIAGYHDMALEYLERMSSSPLAQEEFKQATFLARGVTLVEQSRTVRDPAVKEQLLAQAKTSLDTFVAQQPKHLRMDEAQRQIRTVLFELAKIILSQAKQETETADRNKLIGEARESFAAAREAYNEHQETIKDELERLKEVPAAQRDPNRVSQLRGEFVETKLVSATIGYELATTMQDNPDEYRKLLEKSAADYAEIAKKYRRFLGGMYAVFYEGRCLQDLGQLRESLSRFEKILEEPNQPGAFQTLRTKTIKHAVECWVTDEIGQLNRALEIGREWDKSTRPNHRLSPDGLGLQMALARANLEKAEGASRDERRSYVALARRFATAVSKAPGALQAEARELLSQIHGEGDGNHDLSKVANFSEAQAAAQRALEEMQATEAALSRLEKQHEAATEEVQTDELQQQITKTEGIAKQQRTMALATLRLALELAGEDTSTESLNALRYRMCYVYYAQQQFFDAAVIAEHVIQFYPQSEVARMCGEIAMAAYQQLYTLNQTADRRFETDRLVAVADRITENWPDTPEAEKALLALVHFMVIQGKLELAQDYLKKFPADSGIRANAELITGQAIWAEYLRQSRAQIGDKGATALDTVQLDGMRATAQRILCDGVDHIKLQGPSGSLIRAMLALAQIYVDTGHAEEALTLLNDVETGPKTLVDNGHEVTRFSGVAQEILKTTLRAHIGVLVTGGDTNRSVLQAEAVMDQMQKIVGDTPDGRKQLVAIYFSLARDLRAQVELASPTQRSTLIRGFEVFLERVYTSSSELSVLNWVADTYFNLAAGMTFDAGGKVSPAVRGLYEKSLSSFQGVLAQIEKGSVQANSQIATQVHLRIAGCHRALGNFNDAAQAFAEVLAEKEMLLNVQIAAAESFQEGGDAGDPAMYRKAIVGDHVHPIKKKPVIWGWARLANVVSRQMRERSENESHFEDYFFEARLNVAKCRFGQALLAAGSERSELMQKAKLDIVKITKLYPGLGGDSWRVQYDELLKKIEQAL